VPPGFPRSQLLVYAAVAVVVVVLGARYLRSPGPGGGASPSAPSLRAEGSGGADGPGSGASSGGGVVVHVAGAVRRPGVYSLRAGARVDDALQRAGGPTRRADLSAVNLAAKAEDGRQVLVPEKPPPLPDGSGGAPGGPAVATPSAALPLNLNTATLEQLDTLDGIGPALAQRILDFRQEHGGFGSVDELGDVPGIGDVRMESLRDHVRV
jgi:competence protein ComEA